MGKIHSKFVQSRLFIIILICILIITAMIAGTYAWFVWNSEDNAVFTMSIGDIMDVTFTDGNVIQGKLNPVYNYYDGLSTSFGIHNKLGEESNILYSIDFNISNISSELINSDVKYVVLINDVVVSSGDLSNASNGTTIELYNDFLSSGDTSCMVYFYIDGNTENNNMMMEKNISGNITIGIISDASLEDFTYFLGSEYDSVSSFKYLFVDNEYYDVYMNPIFIEDNEILLFRYNGNATEIYVPDTYVVDGVTYNVVLASHADFEFDHYGAGYVSGEYGIFIDNKNIKEVYLDNGVKVRAGDPDYVDSEYYVSSAFNNAEYLFKNCTSLVNVPVIPDSVKIMNGTFSGCTNLTGTVRINSSIVNNAMFIFSDTSKQITVEVPDGSTTYNTLNRLTSSNGKPNNVTISTY